MKIYVVTSGYYSAYHIDLATVDYHKANAYYKALKDDSACIEEYDDENITVEPIWYVNQKNHAIRAWLQDQDEIQNIDLDSINNTVKYTDDYGYAVYVRASDEDHAIKIAADLFAQYKAEKEGII